MGVQKFKLMVRSGADQLWTLARKVFSIVLFTTAIFASLSIELVLDVSSHALPGLKFGPDMASALLTFHLSPAVHFRRQIVI